MTTDTNKAVAQRWAEEVWNRGNFAATPDLIAVDFLCHGGSTGADADVRGREGHDRWIGANRERVPDFHVDFDDLIAEGDRVVARWTVRGTLAASGEGLQIVGIHIYRFVDGKIAELWNENHRVP